MRIDVELKELAAAAERWQQHCDECARSRGPELLEALKWAMRHLRGYVSVGENGAAYERATGKELVGFVAKWDEAERVVSKAEGGWVTHAGR